MVLSVAAVGHSRDRAFGWLGPWGVSVAGPPPTSTFIAPPSPPHRGSTARFPRPAHNTREAASSSGRGDDACGLVILAGWGAITAASAARVVVLAVPILPRRCCSLSASSWACACRPSCPPSGRGSRRAGCWPWPDCASFSVVAACRRPHRFAFCRVLSGARTTLVRGPRRARARVVVARSRLLAPCSSWSCSCTDLRRSRTLVGLAARSLSPRVGKPFWVCRGRGGVAAYRRLGMIPRVEVGLIFANMGMALVLAGTRHPRPVLRDRSSWLSSPLW